VPQFSIRISDDSLTFSAAHFLTLADGQCERLHGHTYRVAVELCGPLDENQYVADFVAVRRAVQGILSCLDHCVLLPEHNPAIDISSTSNKIEISIAGHRLVFPKDDCLLLPIANTTTELLAEHVGNRILGSLRELGVAKPARLRIEISEGGGSAAIVEIG
jgi:6-pyruvoyltetrahydropterin/6-carboxytetrahydropterin synthase